MVSRSGNLPSKSSSSGATVGVGRASSSEPILSKPPLAPLRLDFLASARLSAMASLMLSAVFGIGGSSTGAGRALDGVVGLAADWVRTRGVAVPAVETPALAVGVEGGLINVVLLREGCGKRDILEKK